MTEVPTPGKFYRIRHGKGGFLTTVGKAYGVSAGGERLALAKEVNNHPLNRKFWVTPTNAFNKKHFPKGVVSFQPLFTCGEEQRRVRRKEKKCFATLWIPRPGADPTIKYLSSAPFRLTTSKSDTLDLINDVCHNLAPAIGVFGSDDRKHVTNTQTVPHRWICQLITIYNPPHKTGKILGSRATGFLFGNTNRLVTSAHVLHDPDPDLIAQGYDIVPDFILVIPALKRVPKKSSGGLDRNAAPDGLLVIPRRNSKGVTNFRVAPKWKIAQNSMFDYGTVNLSGAKNLTTGSPADAWGTISHELASIGAERRDSSQLGRLILSHRGRDKGLFLAGYPGDKVCEQHSVEHGPIIKLAGPVVRSSHNTVLHHADIVPGNSGSPVWLERDFVNKRTNFKKTQRVLIGIAAAVSPLNPPGRNEPDLPPTLVNHITMITPHVLRRLRNPAEMSNA